MALTERKEEDKIEIVGPYKMVQIREATVIERDGVEITRSYHRRVIAPSDDSSKESAFVKSVCTAAHTKAVKDAYKKSKVEPKVEG